MAGTARSGGLDGFNDAAGAGAGVREFGETRVECGDEPGRLDVRRIITNLFPARRRGVLQQEDRLAGGGEIQEAAEIARPEVAWCSGEGTEVTQFPQEVRRLLRVGRVGGHGRDSYMLAGLREGLRLRLGTGGFRCRLIILILFLIILPIRGSSGRRRRAALCRPRFRRAPSRVGVRWRDPRRARRNQSCLEPRRRRCRCRVPASPSVRP